MDYLSEILEVCLQKKIFFSNLSGTIHIVVLLWNQNDKTSDEFFKEITFLIKKFLQEPKK